MGWVGSNSFGTPFNTSLFTLGCAGSLLPCGFFSSCGEQGLLSSCGAWVSHGDGLSVDHWLKGAWASVVMVPGLPSTGSIAMAHELSCSTACGIFLDQGLNPCLLHGQANSLPLSPQGSPGHSFIFVGESVFGVECSLNIYKWWVLIQAVILHSFLTPTSIFTSYSFNSQE